MLERLIILIKLCKLVGRGLKQLLIEWGEFA